MSRLRFSLDRTASGSKARAGRFQTAHGEVLTPVFMPVGTQATVKGQTVESLRAAGARVLLANTYHLLLRPGPEVFRKFGGIHRFMNWDGPVLTDSGGFQIFSLTADCAIDEDGARFRSYVDGTPCVLSPESSIAMQRDIGSDIMMVLDQCIPATAPHAQAEAAMALTHRWARRSLAARGDSPQALFGIVQGACHRDLREQSARFLAELPFDGLAIGGLAVGETQAEREEFTGLVTEFLPADRPRYLMGVGTPVDILEAVHRGVDMFDCIIPSQVAQRGIAFTSHGKIRCRRQVYKLAEEPLDAACGCATCRSYSRAYLHHLVKADELLGWHLLTQHNLAFYHRLMREIRASIVAGTFPEYYAAKRVELVRSDEDNPADPAGKPKVRRPPRCGDFEVVRNPQGFHSIRQISSGEVMHSVNRPSDEAHALYIAQSRLAERLGRAGGAVDHAADEEALTIWDVGLGAASNAMAAVGCWEVARAERGAEALRRLRVVSFERDLDPLRLATRKSGLFPHVQHPAPTALLAHGRWSDASGRLTWELVAGDFLAHLDAAPVPDLIFHDPFSAKSDGALWTPAVFARMRARCAGRRVELFTYSASTAVRAALLHAGFSVAEGVGSGPKESTTIAFLAGERSGGEGRGSAREAGGVPLPTPLGAAWLARWRRSGSRFPAGLSAEEQAAFAARIEGHRQFAGKAGADD